MNQPLKGVRVVDFTLFAAGPMCARLLADWGADVIKVEPPAGESLRLMSEEGGPTFELCNANKRALTIDMKSPDGLKLMHRLIATADVFLTSYRTDAIQRLGLDYETLHPLYPGLVWAQLNGFGDFGPEAASPGFDLVAFWARSGLMRDYTDVDTNSVLNPPFALGDLMAGLALAGGISAALYQKKATGAGEKVMTSLYAEAVFCQACTLINIQDGTVFPKSRKQPHAPLSNTYRSKENQWFMLSALEHDRYYGAVMKLIGREDLLADPRFCTREEAKAHARELCEVLDEGFEKLGIDEIIAGLTAAGIAFSRIRGTSEILTDEQATANEYIYDFASPNGTTYKLAAGPIKFGDIHLQKDRMAPRLGEHSVEILVSLGYEKAEIDQLLSKRVVTTAAK